ncbi:MAG: hypothetical protein ACJ8FY_10575 [Gemmataceae bacterium]
MKRFFLGLVACGFCMTMLPACNNKVPEPSESTAKQDLPPAVTAKVPQKKGKVLD